jgi:hypothetical protein
MLALIVFASLKPGDTPPIRGDSDTDFQKEPAVMPTENFGSEYCDTGLTVCRYKELLKRC